MPHALSVFISSIAPALASLPKVLNSQVGSYSYLLICNSRLTLELMITGENLKTKKAKAFSDSGFHAMVMQLELRWFLFLR
jgi:hypothetical protein